MRLSALTRGLEIERSSGADPEIRAIAYDSRNVRPGFLFVAVHGLRADGHNYIKQAIDLGASAVVVEEWQPQLGGRTDQLKVADSRRALALMSGNFYERPSRKLKLIGITGTNGKTTTAYLLEAIFRRAGCKTGLIGTIEYRINGERFTAERTTPESLELQQIMATMVDQGVEVAVMEASSHALHLKRVDGCVFAGRVFTNLSQDHLDFHQDLEDYFSAKARLFQDPAFGSGVMLVNADDGFGKRLARIGGAKTFGCLSGDYTISKMKASDKRTSFTLTGPRGGLALSSSLLGQFNAVNIAGAAALAAEFGVSDADIAAGVQGLERVPGRFEPVDVGQDFKVIVDYAHTPDGLEKVLSAAARLAGGGRLITVFGCGGDRDRDKRPKMGAIADRLSDIVYVTSDNPRSEEPLDIINDILAGIPNETEDRCRVVLEREEAIRAAICEAAQGDVVVIAGKGHENYQLIKDQVIPFDDRRMAKRIIEERLK